jgi:hypothetical protein
MITSGKEFLDNIARLLLRDLDGMRREIGRYPDDAGPWAVVPGITNCGGTLALHVAGNLQHYIGARLGHSSYVRNRDLEFVRRHVPRAELVRELGHAHAAVLQTFTMLDATALDEVFPETVQNVAVPTSILLMHLATHIAYHLGQLDFHRRSVTRDAATVGTLSIPALLAPFPPSLS